MVQAIVNLGDREDRVLSVVKGKFGLKNKSDAMNYVIKKFEEELMEPELRPEYVEKILAREKRGSLKSYSSLEELKKDLDNA